jgi:hypothetical protein
MRIDFTRANGLARGLLTQMQEVIFASLTVFGATTRIKVG